MGGRGGGRGERDGGDSDGLVATMVDGLLAKAEAPARMTQSYSQKHTLTKEPEVRPGGPGGLKTARGLPPALLPLPDTPGLRLGSSVSTLL